MPNNIPTYENYIRYNLQQKKKFLHSLHLFKKQILYVNYMVHFDRVALIKLIYLNRYMLGRVFFL